jgi:hypothetical protein
MTPTREIDNAVFESLHGDENQPIIDLMRRGLREGTVRASLKRLLAEKRIVRKWDGNERYGRYVYRIA